MIRSFLLTFFFLLALPVHAAFSSEPAPTWVKNPTGSGGLYGPAGNPVFQGNGRWYKYMADMKTASGSTKVPWYMRTGAGSGAYFAARAFTPAGLGIIALPFIIDWFASAGIEHLDGKWGKRDHSNTNKDGFEYAYQPSNLWSSTLSSACTAGGAWYTESAYPPYNGATYTFVSASMVNGYCQVTINYSHTNGASAVLTPNLIMSSRPHPCPIGFANTPAGCVSAPFSPMTRPEFETEVSPLEMPIDLPSKLPFGLPVDDPIFNPNPAPNGTPTPIYSPTGLPVPAPQPRPNPDPYPWVEPGIKINPSPKPAPDPDPWRVDKTPVEKPLPSPTPTPTPDPSVPSPDGTVGTTPPEKDPGLCALFPDILACEKLGDAPESPDLQDKQIDVAINPTGGFGSNNASCPPDKMVNLTFVGKSVPITYSYVCSMATGVRPIVLALAWLSAALIVMGMGRKS